MGKVVAIDRAELERLWFDPAITVKEIARLLGWKHHRPLMARAHSMGLPRRREIMRGGKLREGWNAKPLFRCPVCLGKSETEIHPSCERRRDHREQDS